MIKPAKIVESVPGKEEFEQWTWDYDDELAPVLLHLRASTAKVIVDQIAEDCEGWLSEHDGLFNVVMFGDFIISFDVLSAMEVGQIRFDDIEILRKFTARIDSISANLHQALEVAEKETAS